MRIRKTLKSSLAILNRINRNARAVFFLSTGRTGTAFLAKLFESTGVLSVHEPVPRLFQQRLDAYLAGDHKSDRWRSALNTARADAINRAHRQGKLYVETSAFLSFFTPLLSEMMPNAKFIYVHRHPGEIVRSGMRRRWYDGHPNDHTRLRPRVDSEYAKLWDVMSPFEKTCWYWAYYNDHCLSCVKQIERSRVLVVPFAEMTHGVFGAQKILRFVGCDVLADDQVRRILARPENVQNDGEFSRHSEWDHEKKATLMRIAGFCMDQLGYTT